MSFLNIGFNNSVSAARIISIVGAETSTSRRLKHEAQKSGRLVDATSGRRTRSLIVADSGHVILSSVEPETLLARLEERKPAHGQ
ncbi:MAG: DUF370 domain-containing protein [Candidatus Omnitrophica bacterium]|nr:DUF370 domain-containing protein [Candidatus Omnitrophota bacterium]